MTRPVQIPLDLQSVPALGREDFFVSPCNQFAVHWVEEWAADTGGGWAPYPALTLYGPQGSGKSHLAEVWRKKANAQFLTADDFRKVSEDDILARRDNLVIDNIDTLAGDADAERKLFHLYNHCLQNNCFFLGLSRTAPEKINFTLKDLASRLRAAPSAAIAAPDDDLLTKVLAKRFHDQGYVVGDAVLQFALTRMERSWEAINDFLTQAISAATTQKKPITIPLLREFVFKSPAE